MLCEDTAEMVLKMIRCYSELIKMKSFDERLQYLKLDSIVGEETFGFERYLNQKFYNSSEWRSVRDYVIARDNGCDLGVLDCEIRGKIFVHHMNPILTWELRDGSEATLNPEYLISVSHNTHNFIHYGHKHNVSDILVERKPNDTSPWLL